MIYILLFLPVGTAAIAAVLPSNRHRGLLIPVTAVLHSGALAMVWRAPGFMNVTSDWLVLDSLGLAVQWVIEILYLFCAFYALGYLRVRQERSNRVFVVCLLLFLTVATVVTWSRHFGVTWIAIEATTLVTAPLIYFNHNKLSIEATWKYLMVSSVGIALALLGTFFIAYAMREAGIVPSFAFDSVISAAPRMDRTWFRAGFVLLLVGYGTKMGIAPMHTWKPDAYGEAPGIVGTVLAGGVTSLAFLAFVRVYQVMVAAGESPVLGRYLTAIGLFSMAVAGVLMIGQKDFKRMLAYSSVEHMGILMFGLGIGVPALFGMLLHVMMNALTKGVLFLSAGNIRRAYGSKSIDTVSGALRAVPVSASVFIAGFFAVVASPPFGPFRSEFAILSGAIHEGRISSVMLFLLFLLIVFLGMGKTVLSMMLGEPSSNAPPDAYREPLLTVLPPLILVAVVLFLGVALPAPIKDLFRNAALLLEPGL
ncbi:proton-conducting transporter membrane subunit [Marispirochaeta aestuarii]|uniref:proton-conducting transporter transmembrane domain-containing protein n=1 Tax=Marispirochaeta aestuarii TaxID=1963862 RepID=UPI002ABDBE3F|nr:proton-conducting transporter membrane subunit [Marispirochaeta aestuarii]